MATIFRSLFRGKKAIKKEEEVSNSELAREISNRRSFRAGAGSSSVKSARRMTARFADDGMLSATAAYHTDNAPKLRKGPQSCPGGYRDESECSFESDKYSTKSGRRRGDNVNMNQSVRPNYTIDEDRVPLKSSRKQYRYPDIRRRGDTSEYGSGDPSPIGNFNNRHSHYDERLEESENDDFDDKDQIAMMERTNRHYMQKWKESEQKRREEKKKFKELERERNDMQNAMFSYMRQADQLKKEKEKYKAKLRLMENQLNELRQQQFAQMNFNAPFNYCSQPHRSSGFMSGPNATSNTPTTMNSTGGAGESLVHPGDMSLLQFQPMSVPTLNLNATLGNSPTFKVPGSDFNEEDEDEVKNFRSENLVIETARLADKKPEDFSISPSSSADSNITLSENNKENAKPDAKLRSVENNRRSFSIMSI